MNRSDDDALVNGVLALLRNIRARQLSGELGRPHGIVSLPEDQLESLCWCGSSRVWLPRSAVLEGDTTSCGDSCRPPLRLVG